ncbi:hypothetical protein [Sphingomonas bacterium]|uniref:hypothetical protein n=1 Tax=Sphingomonas bacterium TaxID=1895847 RepID=UPI0026208DE7|nr:hypothetical protein [Sphingomonas bacterium]MDB5677487.1 hypothetical protein [Sphingomonas bacterium]
MERIVGLAASSDDTTSFRAAMPVGDVKDWLTHADTDALYAATYGRGVQFSVVITVSGNDQITDCRLEWSSGPVPSELLCAILGKRGRFIHGLTKDGTKSGGVVKLLVSYMSVSKGGEYIGAPPAPAPPGWRPYQRRAAPQNLADLMIDAPASPSTPPPMLDVDVSAEGKLLLCRIYRSSGDDAADLGACRVAGQIPLTPALNADGQPAEMTTLFEPQFRARGKVPAATPPKPPSTPRRTAPRGKR